jgi:hypothetical protein
MSIPVGLQILRMAEARRERGEDILHGWREEGTEHYMALYHELSLARRAVDILESQLQRFAQYAPPQQQTAAPAHRIAPVKKADAAATG